jgi:hypothetical protein
VKISFRRNVNIYQLKCTTSFQTRQIFFKDSYYETLASGSFIHPPVPSSPVAFKYSRRRFVQKHGQSVFFRKCAESVFVFVEIIIFKNKLYVFHNREEWWRFGIAVPIASTAVWSVTPYIPIELSERRRSALLPSSRLKSYPRKSQARSRLQEQPSQQCLQIPIYWNVTPCSSAKRLTYQSWRRVRLHVPPKRRWISTGLHCFTFQTTIADTQI